jgi:hypothetical protein
MSTPCLSFNLLKRQFLSLLDFPVRCHKAYFLSLGDSNALVSSNYRLELAPARCQFSRGVGLKSTIFSQSLQFFRAEQLLVGVFLGHQLS